ncbi:hypothetical protein ACFODL_16570 [Phenylobacterium terrae]|uniref:hypothetical protein n=1 Tax=Phenylobacterium terrae TaxID=2665495 RepID=UPI0036108178
MDHDRAAGGGGPGLGAGVGGADEDAVEGGVGRRQRRQGGGPGAEADDGPLAVGIDEDERRSALARPTDDEPQVRAAPGDEL